MMISSSRSSLFPSSSSLLLLFLIVLTTTTITTKRNVSAFMGPTISTTTKRIIGGKARLGSQQKGQQQQQRQSATAAATTGEVEMKNEQENDNEAAFLNQCKILCNERNFPLSKVKNARDLCSVKNSTIIPGKLFRMGRVSDATSTDIALLFDELNIKTLIDLRSPTEWKDDPTIMRSEVFENFTDYLYVERRAGSANCLKVLPTGVGPVKPRKNGSSGHHGHDDDDQPDEIEKVDADLLEKAVEQNMAVIVSDDDSEEGTGTTALVFQDEELCSLECDDEESQKGTAAALVSSTTNSNNMKKRYFVSLMNEFKYVQGTVSKVRKRDITKSILKSPGAIFSKRVRESLKKPFMDKINAGGLPMLNELLLRFGSPGIKYVLELCADETNYPISFYCTAGKDRTGMIAAIILSLCGVPDESIIEDYTLSANVYAEMNDHKAMVGALSQRNIDPKIFLGAPPHVMRDTLAAIRENYGSVEGYCNWIGFTPDQQQKLRKACSNINEYMI